MNPETSVDWIATIWVPLDGSAEAAKVLPLARVVAGLAEAPVRVLHISSEAQPPAELPAKLGLEAQDAKGVIFEEATGPPAERIARKGSERPNSLIVMAMHGRHRPDEGLGPVATTVLTLAGCPILLARPQEGLEGWRLRRILLPQDGSPATAAALCPGVFLAQRARASLLVLHVSGARTEPPCEAGTIAAPQYLDQAQHEWSGWAQEFVERIRSLCCLPEGLQMSVELAKGDPAAAIVHAAGEHSVDLIVLPWHGRFEAGRAAILKRVIRETPCPLLLLPSEVPEVRA